MAIRSQCVDDSLVVTLDPAMVRTLPFDPTTPLQARVENGEIVLRPAELSADVPLDERLGVDGDVGEWTDDNTDVNEGFGEAFEAEFESLMNG